MVTNISHCFTLCTLRPPRGTDVCHNTFFLLPRSGWRTSGGKTGGLLQLERRGFEKEFRKLIGHVSVSASLQAHLLTLLISDCSPGDVRCDSTFKALVHITCCSASDAAGGKCISFSCKVAHCVLCGEIFLKNILMDESCNKASIIHQIKR